MGKFFPGCRVRIIRSDGWPELAGEEGRIIRESVIAKGEFEGKPGWLVAPDIWGTHHAPYVGLNGGFMFCPIEDYLEPILPEGMQPSEWENVIVWDPSMIKEKELCTALVVV